MIEPSGALSPDSRTLPLASDRPFVDGRRCVVVLARDLTDNPSDRTRYERIRAFDAAGWATHLVVIRDAPTLPDTVDGLRGDNKLPTGTSVHCFGRRDRRIRASWWAIHEPGEPITPCVADWLDWLTGQLPGAVVIVDEPEAYSYVAAMSNPLVARIAGITTDPAAWPPAAPLGDLDAQSYGEDPTPTSTPTPEQRLAGFEALVAASTTLAAQVRAVATPPVELAIINHPDQAQAGAPELWVELAARWADLRWDRSSPVLLTETVATLQRILRFSGVLAGSSTDLPDWTCTLPGLVDPAGTVVPAASEAPGEGPDDDVAPHDVRASGLIREVDVLVRSNALAYVAASNDPFELEFADGVAMVPLLSMAFDPRIIASLAGNATMIRQPDGRVLISHLEAVVEATEADGRHVVHLGEGQPTDVTHALRWSLDIDWGTFTVIPEGVAFEAEMRAARISPGDPPPCLCVADVAGYSRPVGPLHYTGEARLKGPSWRRPVAGVLQVDPLVATTALAGGGLELHLGVPGGTAPVGALRTRGRRRPIQLSCPRGRVTMLAAPEGQVLITPGRGYRVRAQRLMERKLKRG